MLSFGNATHTCTKHSRTLNMFGIVLVKTWKIKIDKSMLNRYI